MKRKLSTNAQLFVWFLVVGSTASTVTLFLLMYQSMSW